MASLPAPLHFPTFLTATDRRMASTVAFRTFAWRCLRLGKQHLAKAQAYGINASCRSSTLQTADMPSAALLATRPNVSLAKPAKSNMASCKYAPMLFAGRFVVTTISNSHSCNRNSSAGSPEFTSRVRAKASWRSGLAVAFPLLNSS